MEKTEKINSDDEFEKNGYDDEPHQHEINTGFIFTELVVGDGEKWKRYDRKFLDDTVQEALNSALFWKNIITVKYNGKNGNYLEGYRKTRYPSDLDHSESTNRFPFPEYFLKPDKDSNYCNIVEYTETCIIKKGSIILIYSLLCNFL